MLSQRKQIFEVLNSAFSPISFPSKSPSQLNIPLFSGKVAARFPSPADDYIEKTLDLMIC